MATGAPFNEEDWNRQAAIVNNQGSPGITPGNVTPMGVFGSAGTRPGTLAPVLNRPAPALAPVAPVDPPGINPPSAAAIASKVAGAGSNPDNRGMAIQTSPSGLDYAGRLQQAINEGNTFNDNSLPTSVGQSVTGIAPREAPDPNFFANQRSMDDAMRASNIRYQTLNSISSMIQDIQNRMGNNYGNRMDQAMSVPEGTKAINNLMSGIGNFGSIGREVEGQQKSAVEMADVNSKTAHFNQLAEDARAQRAIEMGKLDEQRRSNMATEAIHTTRNANEMALGQDKINADLYGHNLAYKGRVDSNDARAQAVTEKLIPKYHQEADDWIAQNDKLIRQKYEQEPQKKTMSYEAYKERVRQNLYRSKEQDAADMARRNHPDVNDAILRKDTTQ